MNNPAVIAELKRIADEHGGMLNPADVVEAARPIDSILHSKFEWDDTKAAQDYRLWQARQLVRVCVEFIGPADKGLISRVFVSMRGDRIDGGYRTMVNVMSDPTQRQKLLNDALEELAVFQKKYQELQELSAVFSAIQIVSRPRTSRRRRAEVQATT